MDTKAEEQFGGCVKNEGLIHHYNFSLDKQLLIS